MNDVRESLRTGANRPLRWVSACFSILREFILKIHFLDIVEYLENAYPKEDTLFSHIIILL